MSTFFFTPMGRLGYLLCIPVLGLLGYGAFMLILGTALQYPGNVPANITWVYFAYTLIFSVPLFFVQAKRLRSIGAPVRFAIGISLAAVILLYVLSQIPGGRMLSFSVLWFVLLGGLPAKARAGASTHQATPDNADKSSPPPSTLQKETVTSVRTIKEPSMSKPAISYDDIILAHERIRYVAHKTPVFTSTTANAMTGAEIFFKCENFQRMGAFKFRGGYNALAQFTPEQREKGVVAFSSGNHAQAIALSAKLLKMRAVIVMPKDAPAPKVAATQGYGAEVIFYDRYTEDRVAIGNKLAAEQGLTLIPPYDHPHVMAGQGTAAKELLEEAGDLDVLLTPLGGGGLLAGSAVAAKALCPDIIVFGVEPEAGNDGQQSFRSGKVVRIDTPKTIADGAQTQFLGDFTFPIIREQVTDILTVTDAELVSAMRFFAERMKMVVEPTGCLAAAAVFNKKFDVKGKRIGVVLSGGNVDVTNYADFLKNGI